MTHAPKPPLRARLSRLVGKAMQSPCPARRQVQLKRLWELAKALDRAALAARWPNA